VLKKLAADSRFHLEAFAYRQTHDVWKRQEIAFADCEENISAEDCTTLVNSISPALVLTATSMNGVDLEKRFIAAARHLSIPSLAILDFWSNYRPRFENNEGELDFLPDRIAVMDEHARNEMIKGGFPPSTIAVTGQPAFDDLRDWAARKGTSARKRLRTELGISDEEKLVLFASQPIAELYGESPQSDGFLGFTQHSVLQTLFSALQTMSREDSGKFVVWLRPHPREELSAYSDHVSDWNSPEMRVFVSSEGTPLESAVAADVVTGMNSVLLVEAALMHLPVISLQPDLRGFDTLPLSRLCLGQTLYSEELENWTSALRSALDKSQPISTNTGTLFEIPSSPSAVDRVLFEIEQMLAR
jgi:hypothetical protein